VPLLVEKMKTGGDWKELESSILAIGAVARGCSELETMSASLLPQFVPYMVENLRHDRPLVRTISCWSLTRYSSWICMGMYTNNGQSFHPVLEGLLRCVLDKNKKVQESACSSLATFVEEARDLVNPHLELILRQLMEAFHTYQAKNFLILLDAINTVVSVVGDQLMQEPKYREMILGPLLARWNEACEDENNPDNNAELRSIMECLTSLAISLRTEFQSYAKGIFDRCLHLMKSSLEYLQDEPDEQHPKDVLISAIDLVDGRD
jgi:transportin-1